MSELAAATDPAPIGRPIGWWGRAALVVPAAVSLLLGLWRLDAVGLWTDEIWTAKAISDGPTSIALHLWEAPLIPYYVLEWLWTGAGAIEGDAWLRASSVLATVVAVGLTTRIGFLLTEPAGASRAVRTGLAAGLLLAVTPAVDRLAQEARGYALATMLVALSTLLLVEVATGRRARRRWIAYAVSLVATGVLAPYALAVVPAHLVLVAVQSDWRPHLRSWAMSLIPLLGVGVVGVLAVGRFSDMHAWADRPRLDELPAGLMLIGQGGWGRQAALHYGPLLAVLALFSRRGIVWLAGTAASILTVFVVSFGPMSWWLGRTLVPFSVLLAVAAGLALGRLLHWRLAIAALIIVWLLAPEWQYTRTPGARGLDVRAAAAIIEGNAQPGDVVNTAINDLLSWGVQRYVPTADDYVYAPAATGRAWVLDGRVECPRLREWRVPRDGTLVLCASLPAGWQDAVDQGADGQG